MRTAFITELQTAMRKDPSVMLVVGDLGFGVVTELARERPAQFLNAGVAEQNMTGLAAGLAMEGRTVFTYSIGNFPVARCLEQIRNDVCYHQVNVKVVCVGGGFAYGSLGASHHATEDLAFMRALPGMTVFAPNDPEEAAWATRACLETPGPCYLRLGRAGEARVHQGPVTLTPGSTLTLRDGADVTLFVSGGLLGNVLQAADALAGKGVSCRVVSVPTLKPLDQEDVRRAMAGTAAVFTVEEHSIIGGLGSALAELLAEGDERPALFRRIGTPDRFGSVAGDQEYLRALHGLSADGIAQRVASALEATRRTT